MQQNQNDQKVSDNQHNQQQGTDLQTPLGQRQGTNPGYHHPHVNTGVDEPDISEIPEEHHNKEGQHISSNPTNEDRRRVADEP